MSWRVFDHIQSDAKNKIKNYIAKIGEQHSSGVCYAVKDRPPDSQKIIW